MNWNWRGFLSRHGIYQFLNYIRKRYFQKPRTIEEYRYLAEGNYLTQKQVLRLIDRSRR